MKKTVKKTVLDNGVRILTRKIPHVRSVSMGVWVNVGARDESIAENGLSHFIEHMLFKGTQTRTAYQLAKEFDAIGGHTNAFTSMECTCYHARVLDTHLTTMVDLLSDIFLNSKFDPREIDNERPVILSEIGMIEDSPEENVHTLLEENFWKDHPLGRSILGSSENIQGFDAEAVKLFFKKFYQPRQVVISAAGNIDHEKIVELIAPSFGVLTQDRELPKRTCPDINSHIQYNKKALEQVHICIANKGLSLKDPSRFASSLMSTILGGNMSSRLFQEIREKRGLAYSVYSFSSLNEDSGLFGTYTGVSPENVNKSVELILQEFEKLCIEEVSENELSDAKEYTKGNILLSAESTDNQMVRIAQNEINFGRYIPTQETIDKINNVTPDDILRLANKLFKSTTPSITLLGPSTDDGTMVRLIKDFL